ncbi:hypothetical protein A2U01_0007525 [Trifolium medium]|uniref:RNA-directed DNA polymerase (Reverse transcriptase) n=1 Tax=Trifolium medium TaxID=97028 RepID=A0A392MHT9_9FABA|nr:hypothetical protein [Trifolium medium]
MILTGTQWEEEDIQNTFLNYFQGIFQSSNSDSNIDDVTSVVANRITPDMKSYLDQDYTAEEVYTAIKQMSSLATPGPDGLSAIFYRRFWDIIGSHVTTSILNILNNSYNNISNVNNTFICLIPKTNHPSTPSDYRPIALCMSILKLSLKPLLTE